MRKISASDANGATLTLLCARFFPERYGGVEEHLWQSMRALASDGLTVRVITENRIGAAEREVLPPGIEVRRLPPFHPGRLWRVFYAAQVEYWRRAVNAHVDGGTIWASDPTMALGARLARPRQRVIFNPAACAAGMRHIWTRRPEVISMNLPHHLLFIDRLAYLWSSQVVVSSANLQRQFRQFYRQRPDVHIAPLACEPRPTVSDRATARRQFDIPADGFAVGFVGRLDPCKDVPFLLYALAALPLGADDRLLVVGDGPDRSRIERHAADLGISNHVVWAGRLTNPVGALAAVDVLVLPSVYEAFGLVLVEAMSAGVPVIGRAGDGDTVLTASDEIIDGAGGVVIPANDVGALTAALDRLRHDERWRLELATGAKAAGQRRGWNDVARDYVGILRGGVPSL